jgi:hypothetical protein
MDAITVHGSLSRVYVDREHVKEAQGAARPWIVENDNGKFRCKVVQRLEGATSVFDINAKPALWFATCRSVVMLDVEVLP